MAKRSFESPSPRKNGKIDPNTGKITNEGILPVICERIRFYREKIQMEQKTLAARIGITGNSVSNWENGRSRPDVNLLPAICKVLGITLYELFDVVDPNLVVTDAQYDFIKRYDALSPGHRFAVDNMIDNLSRIEEAKDVPELKVLLYFSRTLAAGVGDPTEFEDDAEPVYLYNTSEISGADSIFRVNGDSMEPEFSDGQEVLVQRLSNGGELDFEEIGAFIVGNETYIKKYEKDGLHSLNPDYSVMYFNDDESVYLIGRVLGVLDPSLYADPSDIEKYRRLENYK